MRPAAIVLSILLAATVATDLSRAADVDSKALGKANRALRKGQRAMDSGNLDGARMQFDKSLQAVPGLPGAHIGLGQLDMQQGSFDDALEHFRRAERGYRDLGELLTELRSKRYAEAQREIVSLRDSIQTLLANESSAPPGGYGLQISRLENRISQLEAVEAPDASAADEPPGEIYFYIGNALFQLGRLDEALAAWETCREKSPRFPMVHNNLALAYWRVGRLQDARQSLALAEELGFPVNPGFKADLDAAASR